MQYKAREVLIIHLQMQYYPFCAQIKLGDDAKKLNCLWDHSTKELEMKKSMLIFYLERQQPTRI